MLEIANGPWRVARRVSRYATHERLSHQPEISIARRHGSFRARDIINIVINKFSQKYLLLIMQLHNVATFGYRSLVNAC